MPFDSSPQKTLTRLDKLERLLWLAERATGDQGTYCSCLYHDAVDDPILMASGMPIRVSGRAIWWWNQVDKWLGRRISEDKECVVIFGVKDIKGKRAYLRDLIARERAGKSKGEQR